MSWSVGDRCEVGGKPGVVRFMGPTQFAPGDWVGVELDTAEGKNDGKVNDVEYFPCRPNHGLFVRKVQVKKPRGGGQGGSDAGPASASPRPTGSAVRPPTRA